MVIKETHWFLLETSSNCGKAISNALNKIA